MTPSRPTARRMDRGANQAPMTQTGMVPRTGRGWNSRSVTWWWVPA